MPIAKKECWQCLHFNEGRCEAAAAYARGDGYPLQRDGALVAKDADATLCQDHALTVQRLKEMLTMGYSVPFAPVEMWEALDAFDGDTPPEANLNAGIDSKSLDRIQDLNMGVGRQGSARGAL